MTPTAEQLAQLLHQIDLKKKQILVLLDQLKSLELSLAALSATLKHQNPN